MYGASEIVRGAANTPQAIKAQQEDLEWDPDKKTYVAYKLDEEAGAVLGVNLEEKFPKKATGGNATKTKAGLC